MNRRRTTDAASPDPIHSDFARSTSPRRPSKTDSQPVAQSPLHEIQQSFGNRQLGELIQTKLKISQPGDAYEQEADKVADQVMSGPGSDHSASKEVEELSKASPALQRRTYASTELQRPADEQKGDCEIDVKDDLHLMAKHAPDNSAAAATQKNSHLGVAEGGGEPLAPAPRQFFESRFGADFSDVRIHSDNQANESAKSMNALAYTRGRDVVFGAGQFAPETLDGKRLLAHELAHVVQQGGSETVRTDDRYPEPVQLKTQERAIFRQVPNPPGPAPPANLNYENLADRIHEAIHGGLFGWGTDEEQVYLALQQLQRNSAAINQLETVYFQKFHLNLEADIRDDFSGEELEFALQLLNLGTAGSAQAIGAAPTSSTDLENAARRLRRAVEGLGTDEEAIYAVLLPFNRDMRLIHDLMNAYSHLFNGENLRERIIDEMSGSELDYALYLLGGPAVRANVEIAEVTLAEATRLFNEMAQLTFWTTTDQQAPVPYHYPPDGCYARAHLMAQRLTELGIASEKVFAISTAGGLHVSSSFAADMPPGQQATPTVQWWYHVAPIIHVRNSVGGVTEMVIDPSLAGGPITIRQWTDMMGPQAFTRMRGDDIPGLLAANRGRYPSGLNTTFTTDRDVFFPTGPFDAPDAARAGEQMESVRGTLSSYAGYQPVHELAAALRAEMSNPVINVAAVLAAINSRSHSVRVGLWAALFPNLVAALYLRVNPADQQRIQAALTAP